MTNPEASPILFAFGLHAHQPEGNFGHVFQEHLQDVYEPFLRTAMGGGLFPLSLHISGPLLDWMEANATAYLDLIGEHVDAGRVELLLAGYYEPVLPSLLREDRSEQIGWMQEALRRRFGVEARGLWLTERVWEPELAEDLAGMGVDYVLVDDRHFVASGFSRDSLHAPFRTEASGKSLGVFAIDEKLRYLIPFHAPEDTAGYLRHLRSEGRRLAVLADDIEKFGGWPGTREWVYERGWLDRFMTVMGELQEAGEVRMVTFSDALREVPSGGLAYLPSASYREMEEWSLPPEASHRMSELKALLGEERFNRGESPLIRGSHWRNFLVKYAEANRMHKKMLALSGLCRERGNPEAPRRALGKAQCNDAYWHGVFGGLYLRHLRDSIWRNLAEAEGLLRNDESLGWEELDLDMDGHPEIWIHSSRFSALVSPHRGGGVEELTLFHAGINLANTLTRRREAYHDAEGRAGDGDRVSGDEGVEGYGGHPSGGHDGGSHAGAEDRAPSIHDLEEGLHFSEAPPVDADDRAIFLERVLPASASEKDCRAGHLSPLRNWPREEMEVRKVVGVAPSASGEPLFPQADEDTPGAHPFQQGLALEITLSAGGPGALEKRLRFQADGSVEAHFRWTPDDFPSDATFTTELSLGADADLSTVPAAETWRFPITTFSKSERGFDETVQGDAVLLRWPVAAGKGSVRLVLKQERDPE